MTENFDDNIPEEQGSEASDFIHEDEDQDHEPAMPEPVDDGKCPTCRSNHITRYPRQSSPDDYVWQYECKECGATWES